MMAANAVPGLGLGYVKDGQIISVVGFGFADQETNRPVTADTAFNLASVSKVVTGTALMQLWERGRFQLDDPIAPHLDFIVENPNHPQSITFRHLFNHTSSISDHNYIGFEVRGDPTISLRDFLVGYLTPGGKWYTPTGSFTDQEPGTRFSYSNVGTALAGYLAERIGGSSLKTQTKDRIFRPLDMSPAAWTLADLGEVALATPYSETEGKLHPIAPTGYPDWPAGLLRASPRAMTHFMAAYANGGRAGHTRILGERTVRKMLEFTAPPTLPHDPVVAQGLFWEEYKSPGPGLVGKAGSDDGAATAVVFNPVNKSALVFLANRSPTKALFAAMLQIAVDTLI